MSHGLRLVLQGIRHAYRDLSVVEDIDLVAEPGQVLVLVGPSGCGKSTLLGIMGGLIAPSGGTVRCEGAVATPIASGYVPLSALVQANGWIFIAPESEGYPAHTEVMIRPWP